MVQFLLLDRFSDGRRARIVSVDARHLTSRDAVGRLVHQDCGPRLVSDQDGHLTWKNLSPDWL